MGTEKTASASDRPYQTARVLSIAVSATVLLISLVAAVIAPNVYSIGASAAAAATCAAFAVSALKELPRNGRRGYVAFRIYSGYYAALLYFEYALLRVGLAVSDRLSYGMGIALFAVLLALVVAAAVAYFVVAGKPYRAAIGLGEEEKKKRGALFQVVDTIHALVQAALIVIAVNIFAFQIFQVPSESMVSSFLINDRPLVVKFLNGPKFPMSDVKLPTLRSAKRGDVVVFRNPRYERTEKTEFKRFCSQLVYMVTFSLVNLDKYGPDGEVKADPLVKRVIGVPGEKIAMVDDQVFIKGKDDASFKPLVEDAEKWSQVDVYALPAKTASKVSTLPVTAEDRKILDRWDAKKNAAGLASLAAEAERAWAAFFRELTGERGRAAKAVFEKSILAEAFPDRAATLASQRGELTSAGNRTPFQDYRVYRYEPLFLYESLTNAAARDELRRYVLAWTEAELPAGDPYAENNRKMGVFLKLNLLRLMSRDLELAATGSAYGEILVDNERNDIIAETNELINYVFIYYDMRNFPITPAASDEYIEPNHYFLMGDNRYNSLDFRYATERRWAPFDPSDPFSVYYLTTLDPKAVDGDEIEGIAVVRLWPFARFGKIEHAK